MNTTFVNVVARVRYLAHKYRDRVSLPCYFDFETDQPVCAVGSALYHFGVTVPERRNGDDVRSINWEDLGFRQITGPQLKWLSIFQDLCDDGTCWGDALRLADEEFPFYPLTVVA